MVTWEKQGTEVKTRYTVEYITSKKDWQRVCDGNHPAPWELYQAYIEPSGCVLDGIRSVIDCDMRNRMNKAEDRLEQAEKDLDKYRRFISHYKLLDRFNTFEDGE